MGHGWRLSDWASHFIHDSGVYLAAKVARHCSGGMFSFMRLQDLQAGTQLLLLVRPPRINGIL